MVKRSVSRERYVVAAIITGLIFLLGLSLGFLLNDQRVQLLTKESRLQELDFKSLQLQYLLINDLTGRSVNTCNVLRVTLEESIKSLDESLERLETYQQNTPFDSEELFMLQRLYIQDNLRYWQFAERAKNECDMEFVSILYFFSQEKCSACPDQGVILTYYKKKFGDNLLVFPIDIDMEASEPLITLVRENYDVQKYPAIVIADTAFSGRVVGQVELGAIICNGFESHPEC